MRTARLAVMMICLFSLWVTTGRAQVGEARHLLTVGVSGGANLSSMDFQPTIKQSNKLGVTGGVMARYTSERYFNMICAAQLELNFAQRGWDEVIEDGSGNTYSRTLNYIEIPFFAHLGFGREQRGLQFFINLGPQIGFFIGDEERYGGTAPWDTSKRPNGVVYQYGKAVDNKFEYGIAGGLGLELRTKAGIFSLEGRYYYGLSDIYNNSKSDDFGRSANQTITIKMGYAVDL